MPIAFNDHFSGHAPDYRAFRPSYPPGLFTLLASLAPTRGLVWDCGTGNGQAAVTLADHFDVVFATDASAEQIHNAERAPRIEYVVAPAERCPLPNDSVDLVTVAQALHWFDLDRFYAEVRRVCRPGGFLAVWTYDFRTVNPELDPVLQRFQTEFVGPYWPPERAWVDAGYRTIPFPFAEIVAPMFEMSAEWDLRQLLGYLGTWSSTKSFTEVRCFHPVDQLTPEFAAVWGSPDTLRTVYWSFSLRLGQVK